MRIRAALVVVAVVVVCVAGPAAANSIRVRPRQHFVGLVNTQHTGAVVLMACGGPSNGLGQPIGGQSLSIERVDANGGLTGSGSGARRVIATFGADPSVTMRLTRYGIEVPIPLTVRLPCEGTGTVTFSTCKLGRCPRGATADVVDVTFVNLAV